MKDSRTRLEAKRIVVRLASLAADPRPPQSEQLSGSLPFRRVRVGDYSIIYTADSTAGTVIVGRVRHRTEAYRDLDHLDLATAIDTIRHRSGS